jgi:hypothetical protein
LAFGGGDVWLVLWMCVDGFYLGFKTFKMSLNNRAAHSPPRILKNMLAVV